MKKLMHTMAFTALAAFSSLASAQFYLGASVGQTDIDLEGYDEPTSYSFTAGVDLSQYFAVEFSYIDFGDAEDDLFPRWTVSADGYNGALVAKWPVTSQFAVFAKAGAFVWDAELEEEGYGRLDSDDGTDFSGALGLSVGITPNVELTAQYMRVDLDVGEIDNVSAGLNLKF